MTKKITIYDISKAVGVSTTTVTRALNGKPKVSDEIRELVLQTAEKMNYKVNKVALSLSRKPIKIGVVFLNSIPVFHSEVLRGINAACSDLADYNVSGDFYTNNCTRKEYIDLLDEVSKKGYDALLICPLSDTNDISNAIYRISEKRISVATVVTDAKDCGRIFSVRCNGKIAGRTASQILGWLVENRQVAIFTGNKENIIHRDSIDGFVQTAEANNLNITGIYENQDDPDIAVLSLERLLREIPDIGGIYINSANSASVCRKIEEKGLAGKIKVVTSDIFPELVDYINRDIVHASIYQDPFQQGRIAFESLYQYVAEGMKFEDEILIKPQIIVKGNLELFT